MIPEGSYTSDRKYPRSCTHRNPRTYSHSVGFPWHKNTWDRSAFAGSRRNIPGHRTPKCRSWDTAAHRSSSPTLRRRISLYLNTCRCCKRFALEGSASSCGTVPRPRPTRRWYGTSPPLRSRHPRRRSNSAGCICWSVCTETAPPCTCGLYLKRKKNKEKVFTNNFSLQ